MGRRSVTALLALGSSLALTVAGASFAFAAAGPPGLPGPIVGGGPQDPSSPPAYIVSSCGIEDWYVQIVTQNGSYGCWFEACVLGVGVCKPPPAAAETARRTGV
jgi:hypothetical protein